MISPRMEIHYRVQGVTSCLPAHFHGGLRQEYNTFRPHTSLNYRPPAPDAIVTTWSVHTTLRGPLPPSGGQGSKTPT